MVHTIKATQTPTFQEFYCIDSYGERSLYRMNKIDGRWSLTKPSAGREIFLSSHISPNQAIQAAKFHAKAN
jgi:hypothetical protein